MHAFDGSGVMQKYSSAADIIEEFFPMRLELYYRRRYEMIKTSRFDELLTGSKARFIDDILTGMLSLTHVAVDGVGLPGDTPARKGTQVVYKSYSELVQNLESLGYLTEEQIGQRSAAGDAGTADIGADSTDIGADSTDIGGNTINSKKEATRDSADKGYNYLLNMPIHSFTKDKVDRLQLSAAEAKTKLDMILNHITPEDLWLQELKALRKEIVKYYKTDER